MPEQFVCSECGNGFNYNKNLRRHVSKVHPEKLNVIAPVMKRKSQLSVGKKFVCSECGNGFNYNKNLRVHVSKVHPEKLNVIAPHLKSQQSYAYQCEICNKNFNYKYNYKRHQRNYHSERSVGKKTLQCRLCNHEIMVESLFQHLESVHEIVVKSEELQFSSFDEFKNWKEETENTTLSMFIKIRGSEINANNTIRHYYACHRSGNYVSKSKGIRHLKLQGSNKISGLCPAKIRVNQDEDGTCRVKFVSTHVGHKHELSHLGLTKKERGSIATDIASKIPFHVILDKIRQSVSDSGLQRKHLVTLQDLLNIEQCFNLYSTSVRHQNDGTSVEAWVHEVNSSDRPCVLFYKPQDMTSESHPELKSTDFVLIIMNKAQGEILKKYGEDCICVDGTHGLNSYGFELTTLLVLDDRRQGFPCAFLISNRNDCQVLSIFFMCVKSEVGTIFPNVFMSDLAESYFNAWNLTMGAPTTRLYCTWHVDRAWRKNINSKVKGKEKQAEVYKLVKTLLQERDATAFDMMLPIALKKLKCDPDTSEFASYFQEHYLNDTKCWAYCYRLHAGLNTNMHIERMHHTIKYIYMHGKHVKRLDKAIYGLMSFVTDKLFDRLIVLTKGKLTSKIKEIRRRHKMSLEINKDLIIKEDSGWKIASSSEVAEMYFVTDNEVQCKCKLICTECNTCIHRYSCTCLDSSIKWNMCKHIHSICQIQVGYIQPVGNPDETSDLVVDTEDAGIVNEKEEILAQVTKSQSSKSSVHLLHQKDIITSELSDLTKEVSCMCTITELEVVKKQIACLRATLTAVRNQNEQVPLVKTTQMSQKRNIVPQRRLFSTKKKKTSHLIPLSKPDAIESQIIAVSLLQDRSRN